MPSSRAPSAGRPVPVLRCRTPGDLAAIVPHLLGFRPAESLVVLGLGGPRRRLGVTLRLDLADAGSCAGQVVRALDAGSATACALLVCTDAPSGDEHPSTALVDDLEAELGRRGVEVAEALLVRGGSWWSYRCTDGCCPAQGSPIDTTSPLVTAVASEHAYDGQVVLASREELARSLQPVLPLGAALVQRLQAQAADALDERAAGGADALVRDETQRWRRALDAWPGTPSPAETAALAVALHLVPVRDEVASWGLTQGDSLLGLLGQLARGVVPPDDAPLLSVLGWVAYARGSGATALIAVERALATDPTYSLAGLLLAAVDAVLPPARVRDSLRRAAPVRRARRRG